MNDNPEAFGFAEFRPVAPVPVLDISVVNGGYFVRAETIDGEYADYGFHVFHNIQDLLAFTQRVLEDHGQVDSVREEAEDALRKS